MRSADQPPRGRTRPRPYGMTPSNILVLMPESQSSRYCRANASRLTRATPALRARASSEVVQIIQPRRFEATRAALSAVVTRMGLDGEMGAERRPAPGAERFEDDVHVGKDPDFRHGARSSQIERRGKVVLSEQFGQSAETETHDLGGLTGRQSSILKRLVQHFHEGGRESLGRTGHGWTLLLL